MRKSQFYAAALGLLALASCTDDNLVMTGDELAQLEAAEGNAITFGTYMSGTPTTRAGYAGAITDDELKDIASGTWTEDSKTKGFGVFAWYTGKKGYGDYNTWNSGSVTAIAPNFMYNQQVHWNKTNSDAGFISGWKYEPLKFWPNEVQNGAVDDQDNDAGDNPATSDYQNGGNLSFFAYAPYVPVTANTGVPTDGSTTEGITALSANGATSNPIVTYVVPSTGSNIVDLLWGTYGNTSSNVNGQNNAGVTSGASDDPVVTSPKTPSTSYTYKNDILQGYTTNADLNKQKTNGKVDFAFKHALAKVGGYKAESGSTNAGLMVILDIDDQKGAESGYAKEDATKVTITSINIKARSLIDTDADGKGDTYLKKAQGNLDLATGKWAILSTAENQTTDQAQASVTDYDIVVGTGEEGQLNTVIAENGTDTWGDQPAGVLTSKAQNVYKAGTEAYPLVFIPGTYPELTVTIVYTVRTKDDQLSAGTTKVMQKIIKKVTFGKPVELNKQYSLLMHLGLTSVKFDATVSDWTTVGTVDTATPTGLIDGGEIYLPINVGEVTSSLAFPASNETKTINVAGGTTNLNLDLTGLTTSTAYTVSASGTVTGDDFSAAADFNSGSETTKTLSVKLAPNTGISKETRTITVTASTVTLTINIVQAPLPLVAVVASPFNAQLSKDAQGSAALFTSLTDAAGNDVKSSATLTAGDTWITPASQNIAVSENTGAARSATVTATVSDATVKVVISQAAGS